MSTFKNGWESVSPKKKTGDVINQMWQEMLKKWTFRWQEVRSDKGASFDLLQAPLKDMPIKKKNHEQIQG